MSKIFGFLLVLMLIMFSQLTFDSKSICVRMPVQEARFRQAISFYNAGDFESAIPIFEEIFNNDSVATERSQLMVYSSMWLGNAFAKLGHIDEAYNHNYITGLYSSEQPIDPDDFVEIDSLSNIGKYYYNNYVDDKFLAISLELFKKRQLLLERTVGKNHLWANGGRSILIMLYNRHNEELSNYDATRSIAVADTIARLGTETYNSLKLHFKRRQEAQAKFTYYAELMDLLEQLHSISYVNNYHDICYTLLEEIRNIVKENPAILERYNDHWLRWGDIHNEMKSLDFDYNIPENKFKVDKVEYLKVAEQSYLNFINNSPLAKSDYKAKYKALKGLLEVYDSFSEENETENSWSSKDFKYDFYKVDEVNDSVTQREYQKVNNHGLKNLLLESFIHTYDDAVSDTYYRDLNLFDKKYIDTWRLIIDELRINDFEKLLQLCTFQTPYEKRKLLKDDLSFHKEILKECDNYKDINMLTYYKLIIEGKIVSLYQLLCEPYYHPIRGGFKHTSSEEEIKGYAIDYLSALTTYMFNYLEEIQNIEQKDESYSIPLKRRYYYTVHDLSLFLFYLAEKTGNINLYSYALSIFEWIVQNEYYNPVYDSVERTVNICKIKLDNSDGYSNFNSQLTSEFRDLLTTFKYATVIQRKSMWDSFMSRANNCASLALLHVDDADAGALLYNILLYKKGILLASDKNFSDALNTSLIEESRFLLLRDEYNRLINNGQSIDSLVSVERLLQPYLRNIDYNKNLECQWIDIKNKLTKKDISIEFGSQNILGRENLYAALLLPDITTPIILNFGIMDYKDPLDLELVKIIDSKLRPYLKNCSNVYFSPDGFLYNLPIEHLINDGKKWFRLTSTRYIKDKHCNANDDKKRTLALFGGLNYDTELNYYNDPTINKTSSSRDLPKHLRDGVKDLPFTKVEISMIDSIARQKGIQSNIFSELNGTEPTFRTLVSNKDIEIFHFATHGFYWTKKELRRLGNLSSILPEEKSVQDFDEALYRSGLLLSGANCGLKGSQINNNLYDGILTSKEISQLDMHDVDMAVLSACQTGIGEITDDGVFGLQRGFKKAGVNSLLMSLWKVDDKATQLLMTKFYENLLSGKSKLESLSFAQKYLREYEETVNISDDADMTASQKRKSQRLEDKREDERSTFTITKPFADPKYWAAFVLLDALN